MTFRETVNLELLRYKLESFIESMVKKTKSGISSPKLTSITKKVSWNETTLAQSWKFYIPYFTATSKATSDIVVAVEDEI